MSELNITKTMWEFMDDQAFVRVIGGPIGSGKSICCIHELVKSAIQQKPNANGERKSRALIVRNTLDQLKSTVLKSWADWIKNGEWGIYKASDKTFYMDHNLPDGTRLKAEFMFMPLDTPDDVRKALSLELTFLWANEWREIHPEVVDGLLMRLRRYPSMKDGGPSRSCAIFDTNMPDLDTWHFDKMENPPANWSIHLQPPAILNLEEYLSQEGEEPDANEGTPDAQGTSWWLNPRADNLHNLDARYYPDIIPGKSEDFINVYLRCRYGRSLSGVPVFDKTFNPEFHIADKPFAPLKSPDHPLIVGLDFGRCYDDQTEVLTKAGWKLFKDVDETTDLAATMSPVTREFEYTPINFKVAIPHVGDMLLWSGTNIDLCVTPEHRFPYTNRETPDIVRWASAEELSHKLTSHKYALVAPRRWEGVEPTNLPYNMDPILYAEFLGWWMADGHVEKGTNRVTVVQKKPAPDLEMVMNAVAATAGVSLRTKAGFAFSDAILAEHLRTFGPKHGGGRRVPDSIRFASPAVIWAFLMAYTRGDGHIRAPRRGTAHEEHTIWFASRELAGQFQDLAQKVGWGSALRWQPGGTSTFADGRDVTCQGGWVVCFKKKWERVELLPDQFSRIQYDGTVYCLNVPHHILCVRRNGKVSWNGNTPATALLQRNAWGQLVVLDELTSENMGIETFLDRKLAPLLAKEQYLGCHVVIAPDPAGWAKQQIGEVSPVDIIKQRGFKVAKPVTNDPKRRIEAVERVLLKHVDGKPAFVVNPHCKELIKGFRYGYRYKVNRTGVQDDKPEKNASSHCLTGDTLVSTPKGPVRIDTIRLGDVVSTPLGPQRVTATMDRVVDFVYELTFTNGVLLRCTGDHPVSTTRGLVLADALQYSDVLQTERASRWKTWLSELSAKSLSSTESGTTVGQAATSLVYQSSVGQTLGTVTCIAPSGVITMEIYPKAWLFTTKITTKPITTLKTLSCCTVANMARTTTANALKLAILPLVSLYQQQWKLQKPGIDQKKGWRGTESTANACSATGKKSLLFASIVEKTTKLTCKLRDVAFALWPASPPLDEPPAWTTLSARALSVARRLSPTNTQKQRHAVRLAARSRLDGPVRVYDLTVEKAHEFYANGILVGNCMDGLQYGVLVAETGADGALNQRNAYREVMLAPVSSRAWT